MLEDEILTIEEVARYLRVSERTVYDWAQKGTIPSGKIGTVWRFKRSDIESWVNEHLSVHSPLSQKGILSVESLVLPERIVFLECAVKNEALMTLAGVLGAAPQVKNHKELIDEILRREELMTTAIGSGIAIPHVRLASVTDLVVAIGISHTGIMGFQALDNEPVRLLFMIAAAYNQHIYYLQVLSFFNKRLKSPDLRNALRNAADTNEAYRLLKESAED
jgi:PTS system nitrogen regulatory IIA component